MAKKRIQRKKRAPARKRSKGSKLVKISDETAPEYISPSQLAMIQRCPKQWEFRYIRGLKMPPKLAMIVGINFHETVEKNLKQKIKSKKDLNVRTLLKFQAHNWNDLYKKNRRDMVESKKEFQTAQEKVPAMVELHTKELAPRIQPTMVEQVVEEQIEGVKVKGYVDTVTSSRIVDHKTSGRKYDNLSASRSNQMILYLMLINKIFKKKLKRVEYNVVVKTKVPYSQIISALIDNEDEQRAINLLLYADKIIKSGIFAPSFQPQTCGWCGYRDLCDNELSKKIFT